MDISEIKERIRQRVDCRRLAASHGVELKGSGRRQQATCLRADEHPRGDQDGDMSVYPDGYGCWGSCSLPTPREGTLDVFSLYAELVGHPCPEQLYGEDFLDVVRRLGSRVGVDVDALLEDAQKSERSVDRCADEMSSPQTSARPQSDCEPSDGFPPHDAYREALLWRDRLDRAYAALTRLWDGLTLDGPAADYLYGRGIPIDETAESHVRGISRETLRSFVAEHDDEILRHAGLTSYFLRPDWTSDDRREPLKYALVFVYLDDDEDIDTLRFREAIDGAPVRSLCATDLFIPCETPSVAPHAPSRPFGRQSVEIARNCDLPLYVVEGEIDAMSMVFAGRPAVGPPDLECSVPSGAPAGRMWT